MLKTIRKHITARLTVNNALDKVIAARQAADLLKEKALFIVEAEQNKHAMAIARAYDYADKVADKRNALITVASDVKSAILTA